jgi:hypothetical protein
VRASCAIAANSRPFLTSGAASSSRSSVHSPSSTVAPNAGSPMARTELTRWRVRRYEWSLKRRNPITPTEGRGSAYCRIWAGARSWIKTGWHRPRASG